MVVVRSDDRQMMSAPNSLAEAITFSEGTSLSEICDVEAVVFQHHRDDVFPDIMYVAVDRAYDDFPERG